MQKFKEVLISYSPLINLESKFIILKISNINKKIHKYLWQISEFDKYDGVRKKIICNKEISVGLDYSIEYLKNQYDIYKVLILSTEKIDSLNIDKKLYNFFDTIIAVNNVGLDLGSHKIGLQILSNLYAEFQDIPFIISNSSFKPQNSVILKNLFEISRTENVLIGNGYAYGPKYFLIKKLHLQSYFLVSNYKNFKLIFNDINLNSKNKYKIIRDGEIKISRIALKNKIPLLSYNGKVFTLFNKLEYSIFFKDSRSEQEIINCL